MVSAATTSGRASTTRRARAGAPVVISGAGYCVPDRIVTNQELEATMNTSDEFIVARTGVHERRHASAETCLSDLLEPACTRALRAAGVAPGEVDMLVVNTLSPDYHDPSQACHLQRRLGLGPIPAFDIRAQCSGALYGLEIAAQFIATGRCRHVLVACGEMLSKRIDRSDAGRNVSVLLGDGAGALVVSARSKLTPALGLVDLEIGADGAQFELLRTSSPGSAGAAYLDVAAVTEGRHFFRMQGRAMFEHATSTLVRVANEMLARNGLAAADVDSVLAHQPNAVLLGEVRARLGVPVEKMPVNADRFGNMASASLPVTVAQAFESGRMTAGALHLLLAYGSGATWGAALYRS